MGALAAVAEVEGLADFVIQGVLVKKRVEEELGLRAECGLRGLV